MTHNAQKCSFHMSPFQAVACMFRKHLLEWYDREKRDLQWRQLAKHEDPNIRGYSVLVSEIMLQQTQVTTVIPYYAKWIEKWPTLEALAGATLQEVHTVWAGLGYYSRGKRLHDAARKVVNEMGACMPQSASELKTKLPGVGPYTAAAVASIAYYQPAGVVDGNVTRVFSRVFTIGADIAQKYVVDSIWELADEIVDRARPGDFNQALMELGATICTPRQPKCLECPVNSFCRAYQRTRCEKREDSLIKDIEDDPECRLCLPPEEPWISRDGVMNYPRKRKKTNPKQARNAVVVIENNHPVNSSVERRLMLLWQRPKEGLLANLWEFPSFTIDNSALSKNELSYVKMHLQNLINDAIINEIAHVGDVFHQFTHISQTYALYHAVISNEGGDSSVQSMHLPKNYQALEWVDASKIDKIAISTGMKKVLKFFYQSVGKNPSTPKKRKRNILGNAHHQSKKKK